MKQKNEILIHFVGIGGIGMSGISEVLLNQGYRISGSDISESETTQRLSDLGVQIQIGHHRKNVMGASVVVISSAVKESNPEVVEARSLRIPVVPRAEMLGELMRGKTGIAVAGSHGKTTTTSMLATIMSTAGLDPTIVIGGRVDSLGGNAKWGQGAYVVAEADESDGSFLYLPSTFAIITNIDNDHLDHYGTMEAIEQAFVNFESKLPFYGVAAICGEDPGIKRCFEKWRKPVVTYGLSSEWEYYADSIDLSGLHSRFELYERANSEKHHCLGEIQLRVPGLHNVLNALGAIAIARRLAISFEVIQRALLEFQGVRRRFEIRWSDRIQNRAIVEDYGHHPSEIQATLKAGRIFWKKRVITVFQPHRFTRTIHCWDAFARAFSDTDILLVTDVYPAGEESETGASTLSSSGESFVMDPQTMAKKLTEEIRNFSHGPREILYVGTLENARRAVSDRFQDGDLILCLGAGSITKLPQMLSPDAPHAKKAVPV